MKKIVVCGGGTGGHVFPAISIVEKLIELQPDVKITYIGAADSLEEEVAKRENIDFVPVKTYSYMDSGFFEKIGAFFGLAKSGLYTRKILKRIDPEAVIGTGGYSIGPVMLAAIMRRIPIYLHEQNVVPGMGNRMFAPFAKRIFISFLGSKSHFKGKKDKLFFSGNPVRKVFSQERKAAEKDWSYVLSFGGSGGSKTLNEFVLYAKNYISQLEGIRWIHITGKDYFSQYSELLSDVNNLEVHSYITDIADYYHAADLIIARSGAISLTEISAIGKASILVPSPNVANDHQMKNARYFLDNDAGVIIEDQKMCTPESLMLVDSLIHDPKRLQEMGKKAKELYPGDAALTIAKTILEDIKE